MFGVFPECNCTPQTVCVQTYSVRICTYASQERVKPHRSSPSFISHVVGILVDYRNRCNSTIYAILQYKPHRTFEGDDGCSSHTPTAPNLVLLVISTAFRSGGGPMSVGVLWVGVGGCVGRMFRRCFVLKLPPCPCSARVSPFKATLSVRHTYTIMHTHTHIHANTCIDVCSVDTHTSCSQVLFVGI